MHENAQNCMNMQKHAQNCMNNLNSFDYHKIKKNLPSTEMSKKKNSVLLLSNKESIPPGRPWVECDSLFRDEKTATAAQETLIMFCQQV